MSVISMALTPETLPKHELIGLRVRVVEATNPSLVGIDGRVVSETMRTVIIADGRRERQVPKRGTTFEFAIPAERSTDAPIDPDDGDGDVAYVTVRGDRLVARPARRTETTGDSPWR